MSDLVPPMDAEDAFETSYVKGLLSLDMATIWSPRLTSVQEDGDTDGIGFVDSDFCRYCKVAVHEYPMRKSAECFGRLSHRVFLNRNLAIAKAAEASFTICWISLFRSQSVHVLPR